VAVLPDAPTAGNGTRNISEEMEASTGMGKDLWAIAMRRVCNPSPARKGFTARMDLQTVLHYNRRPSAVGRPPTGRHQPSSSTYGPSRTDGSNRPRLPRSICCTSRSMGLPLLLPGRRCPRQQDALQRRKGSVSGGRGDIPVENVSLDYAIIQRAMIGRRENPEAAAAPSQPKTTARIGRFPNPRPQERLRQDR